MRRKNFVWTREKKKKRDKRRKIFYGKIKSVSYVLKIILRLCLCKQTNVSVFNYMLV